MEMFKKGIAGLTAACMGLAALPSASAQYYRSTETVSKSTDGNTTTTTKGFEKQQMDNAEIAGFAMTVGSLALATGTITEGIAHGFTRRHGAILAACTGLAVIGAAVSTIKV